jgi:hypothetical protein
MVTTSAEGLHGPARVGTKCKAHRRVSEQGDRVWDIIEKVGVCMLTTQVAGRLRARPIEAGPDRKAGLIFAVTDVHSAKQDEIEATPSHQSARNHSNLLRRAAKQSSGQM